MVSYSTFLISLSYNLSIWYNEYFFSNVFITCIPTTVAASPLYFMLWSVIKLPIIL